MIFIFLLSLVLMNLAETFSYDDDRCYFFHFTNMAGPGWQAILHSDFSDLYRSSIISNFSDVAINSSSFTHISCPTMTGSYFFSVQLSTTQVIDSESNTNLVTVRMMHLSLLLLYNIMPH
jgi:hypothetical protein